MNNEYDAISDVFDVDIIYLCMRECSNVKSQDDLTDWAVIFIAGIDEFVEEVGDYDEARVTESLERLKRGKTKQQTLR